MDLQAFTSSPAPESYRLIDFETAEVRGGIVPGTHFLIVSGQTPCINMEVALSPRIYTDCPEYWGIEVVGHLPNGICLTAVGRFHEVIPLTDIIGYAGVEVIGATKHETHDVDGGCSRQTSFQSR
jgi:hypothetical protein